MLEGFVIFLVLIYASFHAGAAVTHYRYWRKWWVIMAGPFLPARKGRRA